MELSKKIFWYGLGGPNNIVKQSDVLEVGNDNKPVAKVVILQDVGDCVTTLLQSLDLFIEIL